MYKYKKQIKKQMSDMLEVLGGFVNNIKEEDIDKMSDDEQENFGYFLDAYSDMKNLHNKI